MMNNIDNKNYIRKTFVLDKTVVEILEKCAKEQKRSLNWVVKTILLDYAVDIENKK